jgi:general secretion pathway protein G
MKIKVQPSHSKRRSGGFTLIEIMLVLAIIALLVGAGIYKLAGVMRTGESTRVKVDLQALETALLNYRIAAGSFPTTDQGLASLMTKPGNVRNWEGPYLKSEMRDPWGQEYGYRFPPTRQTDKSSPDIFSKGPDQQEGSEDDVGNWEEAS